MKTISPNRSLRPRRLHSLKLVVLSMLALVFFIALIFWRTILSGLLWRVLAPVLQFRDSFSASEDTRLRAELASTTAALLDRNALYAENLDLKNRLGRDASVHTILAGVIDRPPGMPYDTLLIDAGSQSGIAEGDLVAAGGTTLIGTISAVYSTTARVELFSAPGETFNALLTSNGHTVPLSVVGQGGGSFVAQVPAGTAAMVGDSVVFSGITGGYAGSVSSVVSKTGESFETLYLHLPINLFDLRFVEVWKQSHATK